MITFNLYFLAPPRKPSSHGKPGLVRPGGAGLVRPGAPGAQGRAGSVASNGSGGILTTLE